jgi:hypothetical protein
VISCKIRWMVTLQPTLLWGNGCVNIFWLSENPTYIECHCSHNFTIVDSTTFYKWVPTICAIIASSLTQCSCPWYRYNYVVQETTCWNMYSKSCCQRFKCNCLSQYEDIIIRCCRMKYCELLSDVILLLAGNGTLCQLPCD